MIPSPDQEPTVKLAGSKPLPIQNIYYLKGEGNYSLVVCAPSRNGARLTFLSPDTLLQQETRLPTFVRVHKSYLINLDHVDEIALEYSDNGRLAGHITMKKGEIIPVARRRYTEVRQTIHAYQKAKQNHDK